MRTLCLIGIATVTLALAASPAFALSLADAPKACVPVDSFVFDEPAEGAAEAYVTDADAANAITPVAETDGADDDQLLYFISSVSAPDVDAVLDGTHLSEGVARMDNPVPEPSAGLLLLGGLGVLAGKSRRRRS